MGTRCADHVTPLYPQKLALTSPTSGGRSVGIVRSRTKATEFSLVFICVCVCVCVYIAAFWGVAPRSVAESYQHLSSVSMAALALTTFSVLV